MKKVRFGNSDMEITRVGYGAWAIGGAGWAFAWGSQDDKLSIESIHKALEMGVNWIDTAAIYGCGHSEEVVAEALKQWQGPQPYVFTKCSLVWDDKGNTFKNHEPQSIRRECENSLRRLKVDVIDLYQIHQPPTEENDVEPAWEMLAKLKEEGKVRWIGVSNFSKKFIQMAERIAPVTSLQPPYNLINRSYEPEILPYCKEQNVGTIIYSPMVSGLLTGKMTRERIAALPEDDWRRRTPNFNEPKLTKNLELVEKLKEVGAKYNATPGEIAIAWTLRNPAVTAAIVGARSKEQSEVVMHDRITITDEEAFALESVLK